jgi:hypothetical protein
MVSKHSYFNNTDATTAVLAGTTADGLKNTAILNTTDDFSRNFS